MTRSAWPLRRRLSLAAPLLAVLALAAGCGGDDSSADAETPPPETTSATATSATATTAKPAVPAVEPYTLRVGIISTNQNWNGPEGYSYNGGQFAEILAAAGATKLEISAFPNGPNLNQALQAGELDVGLYGDTPAIVGKGAGIDTRLILQSSVGIDAWIVTTADGPSTLSELAGKTVVVAQGSYMDRYLRGALDAEGLTNDVTLANIVPPPDQKAALDRGDVQAIAATATFAVQLEAQGYKIIDRASVDHPDFRGTSVTIITADALEKHPELPAAWRAAHAAAVEEINADPAAFNAYSAEAQGIDLSIVEQINVLNAGGVFAQYPAASLTDEGRSLIEGTKTFLVDNGFAQSDFSLDDWFIPEK